MQFFDTHVHLDNLTTETQMPLAEILFEAARAKVTKMLSVGVDKNSLVTLPQLAEASSNLFYGVGLHPLYIQYHHLQDLDLLEQHLSEYNPQCRAIAEIGLDRFYQELIVDKIWQKQLDFLLAQLELARKYQLPVSLHSRQSHDILAKCLKQVQLPKTGVVHAFSGSYQQAKRFVDLGYKIGVGGIITYQRANKTRQAIAKLSITDLVLETDSPDMPPSGFQGKKNHPANVLLIYQHLVELKQLNWEKAWEILWQNSNLIFNQSE